MKNVDELSTCYYYKYHYNYK